jgi:hypothetical protein
MQFSRRYQDGYELKCPSFQVMSVWIGLTRLTKVGVKYGNANPPSRIQEPEARRKRPPTLLRQVIGGFLSALNQLHPFAKSRARANTAIPTCDLGANGNKPHSSHNPGILGSVLNRRISNRRMSNFEVLVARRSYFCGSLSAAASRQ